MKPKKIIPYFWQTLTLIDKEQDVWIFTYPMTHKKPKESESSKNLFLTFFKHNKNNASAGFDIDKHRFFVTGKRQNDLKKNRKSKSIIRGHSSSFLRNQWELCNGYATKKLNQHI